MGGNDGGLLNEFRKENDSLKFINVDCSESFVDENEKKNIDYLKEFFCETTLLHNKAKVITSTNVFQHTENIRSFVRGIATNLCHQGIWCLEFPYILTTLAKDNYDQVYHEHIYYYSLRNIVDLLKQEGMRVVNVSYHDMHSGTLRVISTRNTSTIREDSTVQSFLNLETSITKAYCQKWGKNITYKIVEFKNFFKQMKEEGMNIACFGAAAKGTIFLNTCGITDKEVRYVIDDTPEKQGKYIPGTGIKIVGRDGLDPDVIDMIVILAHNFEDHIIKSFNGSFKGKFVSMFPDIKII